MKPDRRERTLRDVLPDAVKARLTPDTAVFRYRRLQLTVLQRGDEVIIVRDDGAVIYGRDLALPPPDPCADCDGMGCDMETGVMCPTCLGAWTADNEDIEC